MAELFLIHLILFRKNSYNFNISPNFYNLLNVKYIHMKIIGIMGGSCCTKEEYEIAYQVGRLIARNGFVLLCGGGSGVMEAAAKGAFEEGGLTIGIMPGSNREESPPNPYIKIPVFTGMSDGRNSINAKSSDIVIAIGGGWGTLSEIALSLKNKKKVILLKSWNEKIEIKDENLFIAKNLKELEKIFKEILECTQFMV